MIKRLWALLMTLMVVSSVAYGEESKVFTFRNGVMFGDTAEQILEKEGTKLFKYKGGLYLDRTELSGIDNSILYYGLKYDKLAIIQIEYNHNSGGDLTTRQEEYNTINEGLNRKYGAPTKSELDDITYYPNGIIEKAMNGGKDIINVDQWTLGYGECQLIIEHILSSYSLTNSTYYTHLLSYHWIDKNMNITDIVDKDL